MHIDNYNQDNKISHIVIIYIIQTIYKLNLKAQSKSSNKYRT